MRKALVFGWTSTIDLVIDVVLGTVWFLVAFLLLIAGFATIPALGVGLLPLGLGLAVLRFSAPIERLRANALLGTTIAAPRRAAPQRPAGFKGLLQWLWDDVREPITWRTLLHHFLTMLLGAVFVGVAWSGLVAALGLLFGAPNFFAAWLLAATEAAPVARVPIAIAMLIAIALLLYCGGIIDRSLAPLLGSPANAELRERIDTLSDARQGAVDAAAIERQRIERDLHDGAQPRLVAMAMTLGMAKSKFDTDPEAARAMVEQAHSDAKAAITDLRQLARGIHPAVLTDRGLDAALSALADRVAIPTTVDVRLDKRLPGEIEAVVYFVLAEALTNVSKHSGATRCTVTVRCDNDLLVARVSDDGRGGATESAHGGLAGMNARVRSAGGTLSISSPDGGPTDITLELPCA